MQSLHPGYACRIGGSLAQRVFGFLPLQEDMRRNFPILELLAHFQAHEPARGIARHLQIIALVHMAHEVEILRQNVGACLEAIVIHDRVDALAKRAQQPVDRLSAIGGRVIGAGAWVAYQKA